MVVKTTIKILCALCLLVGILIGTLFGIQFTHRKSELVIKVQTPYEMPMITKTQKMIIPINDCKTGDCRSIVLSIDKF